MRFAEAIAARHFHLVSSIASAGLFEGLFREDMFGLPAMPSADQIAFTQVMRGIHF